MLRFNETYTYRDMKCIQSILEMIKKGKLEMDSRLKYTWIWHMSSTWSNMEMNDYGMYQIHEIYEET